MSGKDMELHFAPIPVDLLRAAILDIKGAADAESMGYGDVYYKLLDLYHEQVDASWMPNGYGPWSLRDPSIPIVVDMGSLYQLESEPAFLSSLIPDFDTKNQGKVNWNV